MKTVHDTPSIKIDVIPDSTLIVKWKRFTSGKEFQNEVEKQFDFGNKFNVKKQLLDMRHFGVISTEDQKWSARFVKENLDYYSSLRSAVVLCESEYSKIVLDRMSTEINMNQEIKRTNTMMFRLEEDALHWLDEQN